MIKLYVKKPITVKAFQWNGIDIDESNSFIQEPYRLHPRSKIVSIFTPEGTMEALPGDYIIQGIEGEYYPCKEHIFKQLYKEVK